LRGRHSAVTVSLPQRDRRKRRSRIFRTPTAISFYSAKQQQARDKWLIDQAKTEILGQVQPDLEQVRSEREQRQQAESQRQTVAQIHSHISEAKQWPYFAQFKDQIADVARSMPLTSGIRRKKRSCSVGRTTVWSGLNFPNSNRTAFSRISKIVRTHPVSTLRLPALRQEFRKTCARKTAARSGTP